MTTTTTLASVTLALVSAAQSVDRANNRANGPKAAWAGFCAQGLVGDKPSLTIEAIEAEMLAACKAQANKRTAAKLERVSHLAKHGFSTAYGWLADLKRVHEAGLTVLMLPTETGNNGGPYSLTELRRGTDPRQPKAPRAGKGKAANDTAKAPPVAESVTPASEPVTLTLAQIAQHLEAEEKRLSFKAMRNLQPELARIIVSASAMMRAVENGIRAENEAKANKASQRAAKRAKAA